LEYVSQRSPDDLVAREALARTLQALGRTDEAKQHFDFVSVASKEQAETGRLIRKVLSEPKNAELRFEIGSRLFQFGNPGDGVKWLRTVLEIDPNHSAANALLSDFYRSHGGMVPQ
jgi:tetratricopeptide (TPR) repeat protein